MKIFYNFFSTSTSIWLFYEFYFFAKIFYFCFVSRAFVIDFWSIFLMFALKSFLDNSSMIYLGIGISYLFFLKLWLSSFLVWWMIFYCILGIWCIYVRRLCFLFKSFSRQVLLFRFSIWVLSLDQVLLTIALKAV